MAGPTVLSNVSPQCGEQLETIVKNVTMAVAKAHGQELAVRLLPTVTEAVLQALVNPVPVGSRESDAQRIVNAGQFLAGLGLMSGAAGNISVLCEDGTVLITPSGVRKGFLRPEQMVRIDLNGKVLSQGPQKLSSEYQIHLQAYRSRSDVKAVVHTHPPHATTFAACRMPLDRNVLAEGWMLTGGDIPVVPFGAPSTPKLAENLIPYIKNHNCFLLANHGLMVVGQTLEQAVQVTETVEFLARVQIQARALGGEHPLNGADIRAMEEVVNKKS